MRRNDAAVPETMPEERHEFAWLGGDGAVTLRGVWLNDFRRISTTITDPAAQTFALVSASVLGDDGEPIATAEEWHRIASRHRAGFAAINDIVRRVNGLDGDDVKND